ncbi:MAG TPA: efflux RND transporter periplasmic adaptor subunit [Verrucomicrobiales bacterium]|nr:efflux RND transporter periplasmic adaptor subunit [Verrucomicrobiales bacterium]
MNEADSSATAPPSKAVVPHSPPSSDPGPSKKGRWGCLLLIVALIGGTAWWWAHHKAPETAPANQGGGRRGGGMAGGIMPVTVEEVKQEDFEEWVSISGTVTPLNVVTVRSRVDGELKQVLFTEGQMVTAGAGIALIDPGPFQVALDSANAQLARDQALLDNARADQKRYDKLLKQDSIAKQQVDTQASLVKQYDAAILSDRAAIANAELQLGYTKISAPIAGRAGLRQIDAGNMVHASDANGLVVITQMDPMGLVFSIPQERVAAVRSHLAGKEEVPVEVLDKFMNTSLGRGKLVTTDNQIDLTSGTLKVKAELPNPEGKLFPNQFVITKLLVNKAAGATVSPANAIQRGAKGGYAFVLNADSTVALRNVVTGATHGDRILISEGLKPGDKVVTQGVDRLRDGAKVEVITPASSSGGRPGEKRTNDAGKEGGQEAGGERKGRSKGKPTPP